MDTTQLPARLFDRLKTLNYRFGLKQTNHAVSEVKFKTHEPLNHFSNDSLLQRMLADCVDGSVIYDVGSNVGSYSIALGTAFPNAEIHAFEPNPRMVARHKKNLKINPGVKNNIHTIGVSDKNEESTFYIANPPNRSSFSRSYVGNVKAVVKGVEEVAVNTIDEIVRQDIAPPPDVIKIDVEGHGEAVFLGAEQTLSEYGPRIYIEPHHTYNMTSSGKAEKFDREERLQPIIEQLGYKISKGEYEWTCTPE